MIEIYRVDDASGGLGVEASDRMLTIHAYDEHQSATVHLLDEDATDLCDALNEWCNKQKQTTQ